VEVNKVSAAVNPPQEGYLAFYAELDYDSDGQPYHLCTQMRVAGSPER
jgi:hypothetical protein